MVIYVDLLIASTVLVNYSLLKTISIGLRVVISKWRMLIAVISSVLILGCFFFNNELLYNLRLLGGILIGLIAFKGKIKHVINLTIIFYLLNYAFIGTIVVFNISNVWMLIVSLLYIIILTLIEMYYKKENRWFYQVLIGNKKLIAFFDSGNSVMYRDTPIIFLKNKYLNNEFTFCDHIEIETINSNEKHDVYLGPVLKYQDIEYDVKYIFSDHIISDVLLNRQLGGMLND